MTITTKTKTVTVKKTAEAKAPEVDIKVTNLYKTTKQITTATNSAAKTGAALQQEYQLIACSVISHLAEHKDIRVLRHMLDTLPEGMRKKSMSAFMDKYAPVTFGENPDTGEAEVKYNADKPANLVMALTFPWWKAAVEATYVPFNFEVELAKLIKRAENKLSKGTNPDKGDNVSPEQIALVSTVLVQLHSNEAQAA